MLAVYFSGSEDMSRDFKQPEINIEPIEILRDLVSRGQKAKALKHEPYASDILCQRFLGWEYYASGDYASARTCFYKAFEQSDAESMFGLGAICCKQEEYSSAFNFFLHAAELGYDRAFFWVGYMYHFGHGVSVDFDIAQQWYRKSSAQGYIVANYAILTLERSKSCFFLLIWICLKVCCLKFKVAFIALRSINDKRLLDIPPSKKIMRLQEKLRRILYPPKQQA